MQFYGMLTIAIILVLLLAEVAPTAVNGFLILLLLGVILGRWQAFRDLIAGVSGLAGRGKEGDK